MGPKKASKKRHPKLSTSGSGRFHYLSRLYLVRGRSETLDRLANDLQRDMAAGREPLEELPGAELSDSEWRQAMERERFIRSRRGR